MNRRNLSLLFIVLSLFAGGFAAFEKSPKIISKEGNVIIEPGINKNITIRLPGRSRFIVNDLDLIQILLGEKTLVTNTTRRPSAATRRLRNEIASLRIRLIGQRGLEFRLRNLERRSPRTPSANVIRNTRQRLTIAEGKLTELIRILKVDDCKNNPCENGGTCIDLYDGFMCKCTKEFEGPTCSADVNECALFAGTDMGCQNGAQCVNQFGSYSCICNSQWQGIHCNQRKSDCLHSSNAELCGHGTCVNANDNFGYRCICEQGWKTNGLTPACTVDVDECTEYTNPCSTKCINLPGGFICGSCEAGYTGNGLTCKDIDECSTDNGGCSVMPFVPCINTYGSSHCGECPLGWTGDGRVCTRRSGQSCLQSKICHPAALCQEVSNTIVCSCPAGMTGNGVGPNGCLASGNNVCSPNPCLNGGLCMNTGNGSYTCLCRQGFKPPNCERVFNPCATNPCRNGGTCNPNGPSFICSCMTGFAGRLCDSQRSRCGQFISAEQGNLKYPLNNLYNHNAQCSWVIRTDEAKVLNITFTKFEIEDSSECRFDWLQMHDGATAASQLIGRFCGLTAPNGGNIITTTNRIYIWFKSDESNSKAGFELFWTSINPICGGIVEVDSHATIASPGSPGNYPVNRDCKWHLKAPNTKRIKLVFFSLQIEKHSDCSHDYLEISDAISATTFEKFCNSSNPAPITLPSNEIMIHFHSDHEGTDLGFQIHISTVERIPGCGGTFTERRGQIISPSVVDNQISCEYTIRYPKGIKVRLEVTEFKMEETDCIEVLDVYSDSKISTGRWCGKMHVPIIKSASNEVQMNYYSKGGSFKMSFSSICEYAFEDISGVITSPNYPESYPDDETCTYEIRGEANQVVVIDFIDMDLETNEEVKACWFDYVSIYDGNNETAAGLYCGTSIPPKFVSNSSFVKIMLQTDRNNAGRGFKLNYTLISVNNGCGGILRKSSGEITLPNDEKNGNYAHDLVCIWTIIAPAGYAIQLSWISFQLELSNDCVFDYVVIYDTEKITTDTDAKQRFCGSVAPPALVSAKNVLTIKFSSDSSDSEEGFVARYNFVDTSTLCGGAIFAASGEFKSPNWPNEYPNDLNCTWVIAVELGHQVELLVKAMDLEESKDCEKDWLEIRNGGYSSSPLIGKYCGSVIPNRIPSFTQQIYVNFRSNPLISKSGFKMEWQTSSFGCGGILTSSQGALSSPSYPQYYSNNAQCEWRISVKKGSTLMLNFEDFSMESLHTCTYDFVEIYDGTRKIGRYCEKPIPSLIQTTGNEALIRFQTDSSNTDRGFYLSYTSNCNSILSTTHGVIESPNFGVDNSNTIMCVWTIKAPKGNRISMDFAIVGHKGIEIDFIYVKEEGNDSVINVIAPTRIDSLKDTVVILLNTTSTYFRMEYLIKGCVATFHRESGEFTSPNFPNTYPNDTDCFWQIETETGMALELTFLDMDLPADPNCQGDHIEVWNAPQMSHMIGKYCGKNKNMTVTSTGHSVVIKLLSATHKNEKGFKVVYRTIAAKCGGKYLTSKGTINSPNYPNNYDPELHCEWLIQLPEHSSITLTIEEIDIEESRNCVMDSLKIYDGTDMQSDPMKSLCGETIPTASVINTTSNTATLVFDTDSDTESKGFKISFKENCRKRFMVNDTGRIRFDGSDQRECLWVLVAEDVSKHVTFTTTRVRLNELGSGLKDTDLRAVWIYDGDYVDTNGVRPKVEFGFKHPPPSTSLGHALTVKIDTFYVDEFEGFYSIMDNNCGGRFDSLSGTFASPSYPLSYPINVECIWKIVANDGNSLTLTIQFMDIDKTEDCNADYLEVREGGNDGRLIGVFCGNDIPNPLISSKSFWIKFNSDDDIVRRGFMAEFGYSIHSDLNGTGGVIESPMYPKVFLSTMPHSWRISVPRGNRIMLTFEYFDKFYEDSTLFFDGYDQQADPVDFTGTTIIRTETNLLFIQSTRGVFRLPWYSVSKAFMAENKTAGEDDATCSLKILSVGLDAVAFESPGYPHGYESNLNCTWIIVPTDVAYHAVVTFLNIDLEEEKDCMADLVAIFSSYDMVNWKQLDKKCKTKGDIFLQFSGDRYLMVQFLTDFGVNKTGFAAKALSTCGSTLTDPSGVINTTNYNYLATTDCVWKFKVKPGRRIKITFIRQLPSSILNDMCRSYVQIKNGFSEASPNLGIGKYCSIIPPDIPLTSSNEAYVRVVFERVQFARMGIVFKYEEVMNKCSHNLNLDEDNPFVVLKSDNYPNIPQPHMTCVWYIRAPLNSILAVNFADPIDLKQNDFCDLEYVELRDGYTELSPLIGRFCGKSIPNTQYSRGNILRIAYFTDIAEPHIGFQLNVSLGACGGTYQQPNGTILSPKLNANTMKANFSCEYFISLPESSAINLTINRIELPLANDCSYVNHLNITPIYNDDDNTTSDSVLICGANLSTFRLVESNRIRITYKILQTEFEHNTFKLTYSGVGHRCGQIIENESGILKSPGYLSVIRMPMRCLWKIKVPKGRRIKLEFLEYNMLEPLQLNNTDRLRFRLPSRLIVSNDFTLKSIISRVGNNSPPPLYSTDNLMSLMSFEMPTTQRQGFKLRFSSDEPTIYCNENFDRFQGDIHFVAPQNTSIFCRYNIEVNQNETIALSVKKLETDNQTLSGSFFCMRYGPLIIQDMSGKNRVNWFCGDSNQTTLRLPYPIMLEILSNMQNKLKSLDLKYARHNCGGVFTIGSQFQLRQPSTLNLNYGAMDCSWKVLPNPGDTEVFELTLSVDFKLKCDEQFLIIYAESKMNSPHLGRYCNQDSASKLYSVSGILIEYHTSNYELGSTFNLTASVNNGCGGELFYPFRSIDFRKQYQNNVECIWTVTALKDYHIGLQFSGRFFIESSPNCTKDYLLVQEQIGLDEWADLQRICGREPPQLINTTSNVMRLIFRSDDSGVGDGFTANFGRNCGRVLYATKNLQELASPNYPSYYDPNLYCNYTLMPSEPNKSVLLQIVDFAIENSATGSCEFDNLTVYQESKEPVVLCGQGQKEEFRSTKPITFVFKTDDSYNRKGFLLRFGDEMCGGNITSSTRITTPKVNPTNQYPADTVCTWNITAPEGTKIVVKFEKFEFESSHACNFDFVQIFSGKFATDDQLVAKLCGKLTGRLPHYNIKSNLGIIRSVSDTTEPSEGFSALISMVKYCDKDIELKDLSSIYTLDDFAKGYDNNLDCTFTFKTAPGRQLLLEFTSFHIEETENCNNDYIEVRDGRGPFADRIGKFCGHTIPNSLTSSQSNLFIRFVSDMDGTSSGFSATIKAIPLVCGSSDLNIHGKESVTISLGGDTNYMPNLNCVWRIRSDNNIHLTFEKLDIQGPDENGNCTTDFLKVFNRQPLSIVESAISSDISFLVNDNVYDGSRHVFCGQGSPGGYYTNRPEIFIKFFSDGTIEKSGFKVIATSVDACFKNYTTTQGRILMDTAANCTVYINTPQNYSISVYFNPMFFLFDGNDCKSDIIEIYDDRVNSTSPLSRLCNSLDASKSVFTNSNKLRIQLSNSGILMHQDMTFLATDKGPGCGGDLYNYEGVFTSPFYPKNLRNNSDCRWNIRVPSNLLVSLNFIVFDLGSKVTCRSDYLEIIEIEPSSNDQGSSDEITRKYCGEDTPSTYIGLRNYLSVRFRKSVNFDGIGWAIRFTGVRRSYTPL